MFKTKHNFLNNKAAFTLVEIAVVMAIMGVLSTIGVAALISARDDAVVDQVAETYLTTIREAQNNAIAIRKEDELETKAWAVALPVSRTEFVLQSWHANGTSKLDNANVEKYHFKIPTSVNFKITSGIRDLSNYPLHVFFTTPFGKATIVSTIDPNMNGCTAGFGVGTCYWHQSNKPTKEWELIDAVPATEPPYYISQNHNGSDSIKVTFMGKGKARTVVISSNGDTYIE